MLASGDLEILKETPSIRLKSEEKGTRSSVVHEQRRKASAALLAARKQRITWRNPHQAKQWVKGESSGDFIVRHDGGVEACNLK
ncbi:hypothetical protein [Escherichia coli]|uniref:hypothetical protein n=1 Tax=Escherichia coli TaxID=562 RepID=UPI0035B67A79